MKKKIFSWLLVDILIICSAVTLITVCREAQEKNADQPEQRTEQIHTSQQDSLLSVQQPEIP